MRESLNNITPEIWLLIYIKIKLNNDIVNYKLIKRLSK